MQSESEIAELQVSFVLQHLSVAVGHVPVIVSSVAKHVALHVPPFVVQVYVSVLQQVCPVGQFPVADCLPAGQLVPTSQVCPAV